MKIKETFVGFTDEGNYAYFIHCDEYGVEEELTELTGKASHFPRVKLLGEPFMQKQETSKLIKKLLKENSEIIIELNTNGMIRPTGITEQENLLFNVKLLLKNSGIDYQDRIKADVINWFNQFRSKYLFPVTNNDDIDEAELIATDMGLSKSKVYLLIEGEASQEALEMVLQAAKIRGYNFKIEWSKTFWPER